MSDPTRLFEDPGASPALKELLGSARDDGPSAADLARLASKLGPLLVATAPATAAAAAASSSAAPAGAVATGTQVAAGVSLVKVAVIAAVGGTIIAGGAFQAGRSYEAAHPPPPKVEKVAAAPVEAPPVVVEPVVEPEPAPVAEPPAPAPEPEQPKAVKATARVPAKASAPPAPQTLSEVELLEKAMAAMRAGDAKEALALTARHETQFGSGALVQEREMLAIEALLKSGRAGDARLKAQAFRQKYPTSSHLLRLDALVPRNP